MVRNPRAPTCRTPWATSPAAEPSSVAVWFLAGPADHAPAVNAHDPIAYLEVDVGAAARARPGLGLRNRRMAR